MVANVKQTVATSTSMLFSHRRKMEIRRAGKQRKNAAASEAHALAVADAYLCLHPPIPET
jgi:hypothetical protein